MLVKEKRGEHTCWKTKKKAPTVREVVMVCGHIRKKDLDVEGRGIWDVQMGGLQERVRKGSC